MSSDRIEMTVLLDAPRARVWRAVGTAAEYGRWFGVAFDGPFMEGARLTGRIVPTQVDPTLDYSAEPTTLIVFELSDERAGTRLTITESGFDRVPLARRAAAFTGNDSGWAHQTGLLAKYLALVP